LGTIHYAAANIRLTRKETGGAVLRSVAGALNELYLNERLAALPDSRKFSIQHLRRIYKDLLIPVRPAVGATSSTTAELRDTLLTIDRATGLIHREEVIAADARDARRNPDNPAHDFLQRANQVASTATTLIEQGRAIPGMSQRPVNWTSEMNALADAAVQKATSAAPPLRADALAFQAFARLMRARDEQGSSDDRNDDRDAAQKAINAAYALLDGERSRFPALVADCLLTRAAIDLERAFHGDFDFPTRETLLESARDDAMEASKLADAKRLALAHRAWGNATEDLAYYTFKDPVENYGVACSKFEEFIAVCRPPVRVRSLLRAPDLIGYASLARCRLRLAQSGVDQQSTQKMLVDTVDEIVNEFSGLADPIDVVAASADPMRVDEVAELHYWVSKIHEELASAASEPDRAQRLSHAVAAAKRAADWSEAARHWESWALYQCEYARLLLAADSKGNLKAAETAIQSVRNAEELHRVRLSLANQFAAANVLAKAGILSDEDWEIWRARFPDDDPEGALYLAKLELQRRRFQDTLDETAVDLINALVTTAAKGAPNSNDVIEFQLLWTGLRERAAIASAPKLADRQKEFDTYVKAAKELAQALAMSDHWLPETVSSMLATIKDDATHWTDPRRVPTWAKTRLKRHLIATKDARTGLAEAIGRLLVIIEFPGSTFNIEDRAELERQLDEALNVMHPSNVAEFQSADEAEKWHKAWETYKALLPGDAGR
jgi:hypothetical protein